MDIRKITALSLSAVLAAGTASATVFARDSIPPEELKTYFDEGNHTIGIAGTFNGWGSDPDIVMTDADGDGIYVGVVRNVKAGSYSFKVRSDSNWDDSWGVYEETADRTFNSQTDCSVSVDDTADIYVTLDTNGSDCIVWPVGVYSTEQLEPSKYGITGSMLSWGSGEDDAPMFELFPGKYFGVLKEVPAGEQEFKVRADSAWEESYGVYEPDYDRTNNSQTNCSTVIPDSGYILAELDTTTEDPITWPVSFTAVDSMENVSDMQYTGKERPREESEESEPAQPSEQSEQTDVSEESVTEDSEQESIIEFSAESGVPNESGSITPDTSGSTGKTRSSVSTHSETAPAASTSSAASADTPATGQTAAAIIAALALAAAAIFTAFILRRKRHKS